MLAITNVTLPTRVSITVASSSDSWVMSITSICLLFITITVRFYFRWLFVLLGTWYSSDFASDSVWLLNTDYVRFFFLHYL